MPHSDPGLIRVISLMESPWGSGPAKNLVQFAQNAAQPHPRVPRVQVTIVTYHRGSGENALVRNANQLGINAHALAERGSFDTQVIPRLEQLVDSIRPDILVSHNTKSHLFVRWTGLHRRYPWVAFNHGYTAINLRDKLYNQFDRFTLRSAYRVVAVCGPFADRLVRRGVQRNRIRIQHNSVPAFERPPEADIARIRQELGVNAGEKVVLCVGRLSSEKGHSDLIHAISRLSSNDFRLVLTGDGPERQRIMSLASQLGAQERLLLAGHQSNMRPFYAMADVLALPSHSEGSPNVVLEAMAAGLPIAATRVGGVPEILEHDRTGIIVPPRDPQAMEEALGRLLDDKDLRLRLGRAALEDAQRRFTPEAYRESLATFYREVAASRHGELS